MTPVNAFVYSDRPDSLYINTRQIANRTSRDWEETIWHELVHVADQLSTGSFGHGDNSLAGKDETAPVKFAKTMAGITLPVNKVQETV